MTDTDPTPAPILKLSDHGCRCACSFTHAHNNCCTGMAQTNALTITLGAATDLPMCTPCAMAYQAATLNTPPSNENTVTT